MSVLQGPAVSWLTWMTTPWRVAAVAYVVLEGVLGALAFSGDLPADGGPTGLGPPGVELTAFALLLPCLVVTLPVFYVVGALAWTASAHLDGHPAWPVTATFTLMFVAAATFNVAVVSVLARGLARRLKR